MAESEQRIRELATLVLGNPADAEAWLHAPAMALNQQKPIDLMQTDDGAELVWMLLKRMEYGTFT
ncbi:MbcA/ParS/Xre antitoxin family protein [Noviherbaspirillum sp.]|uniref:MbcA/ParS/Xre antitoxin family protein n=1 Tax=Noviherbaspirillum sp. TaxID=1926288 RepID=UPI002FE18F5D